MLKQMVLFKGILDQDIDRFFNARIAEVRKVDPAAVEMMKILKEFVLNGGKRIRPALLYHSYLCFSKKNISEVRKIGIALELIHAFLLIHDDIIDGDAMRRRQPTVHRSYELIFKKNYRNAFQKRNSDTFGNAMGILAGDVLYSLANQIVINTKLSQKNTLLLRMNQTVHKVVYGEVLDVLLEQKSLPTEEDIYKVIDLKTSSYTMESPLLLGAMLGSATATDQKKLSFYAKHLGRAFQIKDDILGMFGNQQKLGKKVGNDIIEGKKTLLILKAVENLPESNKKFLLEKLGKENLSLKDFEKIKFLVKKSGSFEYCNNLTVELAHKAKQVVQSTSWNTAGKRFLLQLPKYIVEREE